MVDYSDKRRLAQNTFLLYGRTIIVMFVSLYVSRLILNILGVNDYGIYNAVGGIVGMFTLISGSLVAATQRYISFELGKEDGRPSYIFSMSLGLHIIIGIVILFVAEVFGVWFLNKFMNLPYERMGGANWVFQFSTIAFVLQLLTIPYNAIIIAQERMGIYALICIVEVLIKLVFALIMLVAFNDKLVVYSLSMTVVAAVVFFLNYTYCKKKYCECCRFCFEKNLSAYRQMGTFVGWNFIGSSATVLSSQGVNVLLNIFCGVLVNAGRGIAIQVENAVNQFVNSFTTAIRPQITKAYAAQEYDDCFRLINQGTKMVMYLTMLFVIPLSLRTELVLTIWLKSVPAYAVLFTQLSLVILTTNALSTPLYYLMLATGKIRDYQLIAGTLSLLTFPATWLLLRWGLNPETTYYILFFVNAARWILQVSFLHRLVYFDIGCYLRGAIIPFVMVSILTILASGILNRVLPDNFVGLICLAFGSSIVLSAFVISIGLTKNERGKVFQLVRSKLNI